MDSCVLAIARGCPPPARHAIDGNGENGERPRGVDAQSQPMFVVGDAQGREGLVAVATRNTRIDTNR